MKNQTSLAVLAALLGFSLAKFDSATILKADDECLNSVPIEWKKTTKIT